MNVLEGVNRLSAEQFQVFVYRTGDAPPPVTVSPRDTLREVLARAGVEDTEDLVAFVPKDEHGGEHEDADDLEHDRSMLDRSLESMGIGRGARIVCACCRWVEVEIRYQSETARHRFRPSARVGRVLRWARHHWHLHGEDFETIKLRLCGETEDLPEGQRLVQLLPKHGCSLCMDLVPMPKVNG